jgi:cytochrome c oxidase assembly factor CtaG
MTGWQLFKASWDFEPSVVMGSGLLLGGYLTAVRCRPARTTYLFAAGVGVMLLALVSPLDGLGDDYLFSAHMLQHILLDFVAPPLFVLGFPEDMARRLLLWQPAAAAERILGQPVVAWFLGIGTLWLWHLPTLYNATLASEGVHIFEHLTFLVTGTIFWWPAFRPPVEQRMPPLASVVYLGLGALANALLGIIFTFASTPFYSGYDHPPDELGALALIRDHWGISQIADQQLGGAFMWVIGSVVFLWAIVAVMGRWYREEASD